MKMLKVVYVNTLFAPYEIGGAEKSLKNLISALTLYHSIEAVIITLNPKNTDVLEYVDGIKIYRLAYRNSHFIFGDEKSKIKKIFWHIKEYNNTSFYNVIFKIFQEENPDLIHTNNILGFSTLPISIAKEMCLPIVHTIRDYYFQCYKSSKYVSSGSCKMSCKICKILSSRRRAISHEINAVVGNSEYILKDHIENNVFSGVKIKRVVFNINDSNKDVRCRRIKTRKIIKIGYIGRIIRSKGILELADVLKGDIRFELYIAGTGAGDVQDEINKISVDYSNIITLGFVSPEKLYDNIDILIVPSLWHEPLSRTIYEAYSYGLPVIGSNTGGTPEIIISGKTGYIFDTKNFSEIILKIQLLTEDTEKYEKISANCIEYSKKFTSKSISSKYYNIYRDVINDK